MSAHNLPQVSTLLEQMTADLSVLLKQRGLSEVCMIGIHTGGVWVARELHQRLAVSEPLGTLDISFYRDDFSRAGMHPQVKIILVDDVLQSGRTVRAALNEIFDYGRPSNVLLAVLVERSGRELPIQADVHGIRMDLGPNEQIKLNGPESLSLSLKTRDE